jgi:hypothetical protein
MTKKYDAQHGVRYIGTIAQQQNSKLVMKGSLTISDNKVTAVLPWTYGTFLLEMN